MNALATSSVPVISPEHIQMTGRQTAVFGLASSSPLRYSGRQRQIIHNAAF